MKAASRCKAHLQGDKCRLELGHTTVIHKGINLRWTDLLGKVNDEPREPTPVSG